MRSTLRIAALILVALALLLPFATYASNGPCPDDPVLSQDCLAETPPFYVVINRTFEDLTRPGSGCQPIILQNPDCTDCCGEDAACTTARTYLETNVCPLLAQRVDWAAQGQNEVVVYEMCCNCVADPAGDWVFTIHRLQQNGTCPVDPENVCIAGLPPRTGIDLPAPVIIGGLVVLGAGLLAAAVLVRRRTMRTA
jgi:hypothetical protein